MAVIFFLSITPGIVKGGMVINAGSIKHLIAYFILCFLFYKASSRVMLSIFLAGCYGFLIESVQFVIPYRAFEIFDVILNFAGACFVFLIKLCKL